MENGFLRVDGAVLFGEKLLLLNEDAGTSRWDVAP